MGVDDGNIQVMDGCRNDNRKLSSTYSYGTYVQVAITVYLEQIKETLTCYLFGPCLFVIHTIYYIYIHYICDSRRSKG